MEATKSQEDILVPDVFLGNKDIFVDLENTHRKIALSYKEIKSSQKDTRNN